MKFTMGNTSGDFEHVLKTTGASWQVLANAANKTGVEGASGFRSPESTLTEFEDKFMQQQGAGSIYSPFSIKWGNVEGGYEPGPNNHNLAYDMLVNGHITELPKTYDKFRELVKDHYGYIRDETIKGHWDHLNHGHFNVSTNAYANYNGDNDKLWKEK